MVVFHLHINLRVISHVYRQNGRSVKPKFFPTPLKIKTYFGWVWIELLESEDYYSFVSILLFSLGAEVTLIVTFNEVPGYPLLNVYNSV